MRNAGVLALAAVLLVSCQPREDLGRAELADTWQQDVETFFQNRVDRLKEPQGWMRLAGMYWLEPGENTFGSSAANDVVFPQGFITAQAGVFVYDNEQVTMQVNADTDVYIDSVRVNDALMFSQDTDPVMAQHGPLSWTVIKREELVGIRLYNAVNERVDRFTGFDRYPADSTLVVKARLETHEQPVSIPVVNILGQTSQTPSPGVLHFEIRDERYSLIALEGGERMFIILGDETNRTSTYQAGRYLYVDYPGEGSDYTVIDFNRSYNPPCAYNPYTTCQFPPRQNILPVLVEGGEKRPSEAYKAENF